MEAITILGSGNSMCEDGRGHASCLVEVASGEKILLDAGATVLLRAREHGVCLAGLDAVFVTHFHGDHTLGLPFVLFDQRVRYDRNASLTIVGPTGAKDLARTLLDISALGRDLGYPIDVLELLEGEAMAIGGLHAEACRVTHRPESLGYRLRFPSGKTVAFSGDCRFDDRLIGLVDGADVAVIEVSLPGGPSPRVAHVSVDELRARRAELNTPRLVLTHLNDAIAAKVVEAGLGEPAHDGRRIRL